MNQDPVEIIHRKFIEKRLRNPNYSLRSFARTLGVNSGPLSEIISRKRPLSGKMASQIVQRLDLNIEEHGRFLSNTVPTKTRVKARKFHSIDVDSFAVIADWYHFAILSLLQTDDFNSDPHWIAKRLGITPSETKMALKRLQKLGFIKKNGGGFVRMHAGLATTTDVPSSALRASHRQALEQCLRSLDEVPAHLRDITSVTFPVDPARLPEAKQMLQKFRRKFLAIMESGPKKEVYHLELCLVPLTQKGNC